MRVWCVMMVTLMAMAINVAGNSRKLRGSARVYPFEVSNATCKVSEELASRYPECSVGGFVESSSTQTCGQSTIIAPEKVGSCVDAQATLDEHNLARERYGAAPLLWSRTLADSAQSVANTCVFQHSNTQYGENLAIGTRLTCLEGTKLWIQEESEYPPPGGPGFSSATGHFTQVVWKSTLQVGCGFKQCSQGNFVVCQYYPAGNYIGEFEKNVGSEGEPSPCGDAPAPSPQSPLPSPSPSPRPVPIPSPRPPPPPSQNCCFFGFCSPRFCPSPPSGSSPPPPPAPTPPPTPPPPSQQCCFLWFCYAC